MVKCTCAQYFCIFALTFSFFRSITEHHHSLRVGIFPRSSRKGVRLIISPALTRESNSGTSVRPRLSLNPVPAPSLSASISLQELTVRRCRSCSSTLYAQPHSHRPAQACLWGCSGLGLGGRALESIFRNDMQQEVVRAGIVGLKGDWHVGPDGGDHGCKLEVERLQVDNQLQDAAHPVMLCISPSAPVSSIDAPAVAASLVATNDMLHIRRCHLHLQPLTVNADWIFASQASHSRHPHIRLIFEYWDSVTFLRAVPFILPWACTAVGCFTVCKQQQPRK